MLAAFMLGLLAALSPCPLATNITAIGYVGKDFNSPRRVFISGIVYALGRILAYSFLGGILVFLLKEARMYMESRNLSAVGALFYCLYF